MARGIRRAIPDAEIALVPLGDGGEGTVDAMVAAVPGSRRVTKRVIGPIGASVDATFGVLGPDGATAVIEMAAASGITLVSAEDLDPLAATTFGTGELIRAAISEPGVSRLVIGIGGSATNDGGVGALQALGVRFIGSAGDYLPEPIVAGELDDIEVIESAVDYLPVHLKVTVACDVTNPLTGPNGASTIFGPQKGADPATVAILEGLLCRFSSHLDDLYEQRGGYSATPIGQRPGAGAAGGLGAGLMAVFPAAEFRPGIDVVLDAADFDKQLADADLVLTGEGKLDSQTLSGKAIDGILRRTRAAKVPAIAFAGAVESAAADTLATLGLESAHALMSKANSVADAMERAAELLEELVYEALSVRRPG
jgi:glycerate kinase